MIIEDKDKDPDFKNYKVKCCILPYTFKFISLNLLKFTESDDNTDLINNARSSYAIVPHKKK